MQLLTCLWSNFINICIFGNRMDFHFNSPEKKIALFHNDPLWNFFLYVWFQISLPVSLPLLPHQSLNDWSSTSLLCFFIRMNVCVCGCVCVTQSCPTLCDTMDCSLPGSSVPGILQARVMKWVDISFAMGFSWPRDWTQFLALKADSLPPEPPGKLIRMNSPP